MLPDQIVAEIHSQVRHGYYPREVVVGSVLHFFGAELGVDEGVQHLDDVPEALVASVRDAVDRAFRELEAEAASWPSPTDCQRIRAAFDALEREGGIHVIANADLDREEAGAAPSTGFCFFHQQDVMSAMDGAGLALAYGTFEDDDAERTRADGQGAGDRSARRGGLHRPGPRGAVERLARRAHLAATLPLAARASDRMSATRDVGTLCVLLVLNPICGRGAGRPRTGLKTNMTQSVPAHICPRALTRG